MLILVCCGSGLGSSFMIEMNIKNILKEMNLEEIQVDHSDLSSASGIKADIYVGTRDLASNLTDLGYTVSLNNMIDKNELKQKITKALKDKGIIK
ncbi:PTS sugar transporter subunit IIB [Clostridiaceae bacterium M8S5]|nr:PTS sugar transporter subunit IIB [Clostridiaceae bacterium M8S5]